MPKPARTIVMNIADKINNLINISCFPLILFNYIYIITILKMSHDAAKIAILFLSCIKQPQYLIVYMTKESDFSNHINLKDETDH